jgi:hypothetical protein
MNYGKMGSNVNSCFAGRLYCQMMPDGSLQNCWWRGGENKTDSFNGLEKPKPGCYCWPQCHAEYSFIFTLNLKAVMNILKKFKF